MGFIAAAANIFAAAIDYRIIQCVIGRKQIGIIAAIKKPI